MARVLSRCQSTEREKMVHDVCLSAITGTRITKSRWENRIVYDE